MPAGHRPDAARARGRPVPAPRVAPAGAVRLKAGRGFTLIELMVSLLVVAGLFALVLPSIQSVTGVRVRQEAGRLAGAVSYLYNHAAMTGRTCRLTFRMQDGDGAGAYAAGCTEGSPSLSAEPLDVRDGVIDQEPQPEVRPPSPRGGLEDEEAVKARLERGPDWAEFTSSVLKPVRLPGGVRLAGFWTPRLSDVVTAGEANLYFFPMGETQPAYIWLQDGSDNWYTLTVQPLTGRVKVHPENLEVPLD